MMAQSLSSAEPSLTLVFRLTMVLAASLMFFFVQSELGGGGGMALRLQQLLKALLDQRRKEGVLNTVGRDGRRVSELFLGAASEKRDSFVLGDPILDCQSRAPHMHVKPERGVLVAVHPIDAREDEAGRVGVLVLEDLREVRGRLQSVLED